MKNGNLNHYLDQYFNDMNVRYLSKEELFLFLKKCVLDFRISKRDTVFYPYRAKNKLYDALREKHPELKNNDISLLCEIIEKSEDREQIYHSLGLEKPPKKQKLKIGKKQVNKKTKINLKKFLGKHFSIIKE
jgi:hypothetical protein